ncbi:MAG: branched-chain alpha-keto acid dehydrogenase subunit [Novosphingobium lindaniclasticum]|jgi:2-oxoisovalerate dehydrogenase E2 component (dihydrolipoyl transacylase)|uniref:dihydrolipoamide acetyltransferase family protein n=1 Tax=Novosphingobium lindaniclasticum TaxID=1329895 RepID=UPI002409315C|nr:dihydrolipoamide acetyltransferase family protein [Novosphingobium lindaniclasticum]MDF2638270.1 branched-chain alpha-keto acid dehydrogenase subunit [Novosphingobium lindaniclasticum]
MGRFTFRLPDIGEGIAEAEIVAWHVKVGDKVEEDGRLADMMTDKATVEMESPVSGVIVEVAGETGDVIAIGSPLVVIEVEGAGNAVDRAPAPKAEVVEQRIAAETPDAEDVERVEQAVTPSSEPKPAPAPAPEPTPPPAATGAKAPQPRAATHSKVMASPAVRKRAADLGIDLSEVRPAEEGRLRHSDLDAFLSYNASGGFQPAGRKGQDEQVRVIGLRRRIAENMAASKRQIPHFAYVEEFDVTALEETRAQLNAGRGADMDGRPKLTMLPFLITAICKLLPKYPMLNAHYDDEAGVVTRYGSVHLGMAAQTPAGLMVPVIRNAQDRNLWQLATEIGRLAQAARDGSAKSSELSGSTITVTSLGPMGGVATTPVINRPEVAIIGPNRIVERPMFVKGADGVERIEKRKIMNISMSCDHRVVDGWDAASFAQDLKKLIEAPALILAG